MTLTNDELDRMIRSCMASGIVSGLVPAETARLMNARLDQLPGHQPGEEHETGCLMCAVRALTEGDPATWAPTTGGQSVTGVVLKMGTVATNLGTVPFVDLWTGGDSRVRIMQYGVFLRHAIDGVAPQIGDRLTVWFDGEEKINKPRHPMHGRPFKKFSANVQRGH